MITLSKEDLKKPVNLLYPLFEELVRAEKVKVDGPDKYVKLGHKARGFLKIVDRGYGPALCVESLKSILVTSEIKDVTKTEKGFLVKTRNSEYTIEMLE